MTPDAASLPVPSGLKLYPFQEEGVHFMLGRQNTLLADEMGLGKSPQCIIFLNSIAWDSCLLVVPAFLRLNWQREINRWITLNVDVQIIWDGKTPVRSAPRQIVICSYDLMPKREDLLKRQWDIQILDEAHYVKNSKAKRSKATLSVKTGRFIAATGTPILNKPLEIWNIAHRADRRMFPDFWQFVKRYCGAYRSSFGWDFSGSSNLSELQSRLRSSVMIRRLKKDVLTDLPAKTRQIIELPPTAEMKQTLNRENAAWEIHEETLAALVERRDRAAILQDEEEYRTAARLLKAAYAVAFAEMSKVRKETALAKLPLCIQHAEDCLEQVPKLIIFAHHRAVILQTAIALQKHGPMVFYGDTPQQERAANVERFQTDPACRVAIVGITAAVGITLTAASHECFFESDWVPANLSQAEDRAHRIGQKSAVLVQHLVLEASLDAKMLKRVIEKQEIIDQALDAKPQVEPPAAGNGQGAGRGQPPKKRLDYAAIGQSLDVYQRGAVLKALQQLAALDGDRARSRNGAGFSKFDSNIGHELAKMPELTAGRAGYGQHLVRRYRGQIDPVLLRQCGIEN